MDNLNGNPLIDEDDDETAALKASKNPHSDLDEDGALPEDFGEVEESGLELPELDFDYTSSGAVRAPKLVDGSMDDGLELFSNPEDTLAELSNYTNSHTNNFGTDVSRDSNNGYDSNYSDVKAYPETEDDDEDPFDISDDLASIAEMYSQVNLNTVQDSSSMDDPFGAIDYDADEDDDDLQGFDLDAIIGRAIDYDASDVHITGGDHVAFTILSDIRRMPEFGITPASVTEKLQYEIISNVLGDEFVQTLELDTSYVLKTGPHAGRRTRLSVGRSEGNVFMVFRISSETIPTPEQLGISGALLEWTDLPNGLVMVNGPVGTGKTTTIASLLNHVRMTQPKKIVTIEKPIEFLYGKDGMGVVTQREVGIDTRSFAGALTSALRQAMDIVLIGEARDRTEFSELLRAAEIGRLAFSTMHTNSAPATINRIKGIFNGDEQDRIMATLGDVARGFANQVLVKTPDGKGRFAVREVLTVDEEISKFIMKGDVVGIQNYQMHNKITMEHELVRAVEGGFCTAKEARRQSAYPFRFDNILKELG